MPSVQALGDEAGARFTPVSPVRAGSTESTGGYASRICISRLTVCRRTMCGLRACWGRIVKLGLEDGMRAGNMADADFGVCQIFFWVLWDCGQWDGEVCLMLKNNT